MGFLRAAAARQVACAVPPAAPGPAAAGAAPAATSAPARVLKVAAPAPVTAPAPDPTAPPVLLGPLTREQVEKAVPSWVTVGVESKPDLAAAHALALVAPGAEVTVFMGTWCSDSRREVSRLWRVLDEIGATAEGGASGGLPFTLRYVGVDQEKKEPAALTGPVGLRYVPTLIVRRDGREVGRIVEQSPNGVEVDLLALLNGKASGVVSASERAKSAGVAPQAPPK